MRYFYTAIVALLSFASHSQAITFNNPQLVARLIECNTTNDYARDINGVGIKLDADYNQLITVEEASLVYELDLGSVVPIITNLTGMENFVNLRWLNLSGARPSNHDLAAMFPNVRELYLNNMGAFVVNINISGLDLEVLGCIANAAMLPYLTGSEGLAQFTNLVSLSCGNNGLTSLDVSMVPSLKELYCYSNDLNVLNVTGLTNLERIWANTNDLTALDLSTCPSIKDLLLGENDFVTIEFSDLLQLESIWLNDNPYLTSITLNDLPALVTLDAVQCVLTNLEMNNLPSLAGINIAGNDLVTLDASGLPSLLSLYCGNNELTSLNVDGNVLMNYLDCTQNFLQTLDLSSCSALSNINCKLNLLETLNIKNGYHNGLYLNMEENPTLQYICVDQNEFVEIQELILDNNYINCSISTYCSFVPGGTLYTLHGNHRFDSDSNGCTPSDLHIPNLKYLIGSGSGTGYAISASSGNYSFTLPAGTHVIAPKFETNLFSSSPANRTVTFPGTSSDVTQDFCITSFGDFPDIEVIILPLDPARPGFDSRYRLIYRNKGNRVHSGSVSLNFDDALTDLLSALPAADTQAGGMLTWNYVNLLPFESHEIDIVLNLNSPTDTPPLNGGDPLEFQATITSQLTDISPLDNTMDFTQYIVNSFDPNDKTCVQGATIPLNDVGSYVTYVIRFENTGNFAAQNVVVSDVINTSKYDVDSFIPLSGSHPFVTRLVAPNRLEFIFENIQLPFDDANNDGFVAFKIKTTSSLQTGDTFENSASIYFDYNFPIVTDAAVTTVGPFLGVSDFDFNSNFTLYPNPAQSTISITATNDVQMQSASIYNLLGQLVLSVTGLQNNSDIDVSALQSGQYILLIYSDKGNSAAKFVKQ